MAATDMFIMQQNASGEAKRMDGSVIQTFAENKATQKAEQFINQHREEFYQGPRGYSVEDIEKVSGTGEAGTYDTYRGIYKDPDTHEIIGYTATFRVWNGENGLNLPPVYATNLTIPTSAWAADTTYEDFPYRALVTSNSFNNLTATDIPNIVLHPAAAMEGIIAPVCATYISGSTKGIYVYASEAPTDPITILTAYAIHTQN